MNINITPKTMFQTSDKQAFDTRKDATIHELGLQVRLQLMQKGFKDEGQLKAMSLCIAKNFATFKPIFDKLRHSQQLKS